MKYVALLRGVNVGGRVVKMVELKACFEGLGFGEVGTLLQTGNVIFESGEQDLGGLKQEIEAALTATFHYPAKAQVISLESLRQIIANYPFGLADDSQHDYVIFMEDGLEWPLLAESYDLADGEKVHAGNGVVYWRVAKGSTLKSTFARLPAKAKYKNFNTNRNLKTLRKLGT